LNGEKVSDSSILEGLDKALRQTQFRNVKFVLTSIAVWLSFRRVVIDSIVGISISFKIRKPI
jgi:NAD(P)H-hydrate repair Nnr-like enzyme with NAD(P)H-hydrate epimerase domain